MKTSPATFFAAGFLAGGIALGGAVAHARITAVNGSITGVTPNSEHMMICGTAADVFQGSPGNGVSGGSAYGVILRRPA